MIPQEDFSEMRSKAPSQYNRKLLALGAKITGLNKYLQLVNIQLGRKPWRRGQGPPIYLPFPPTSRQEFRARGLFRASPCRKDTIYLQTSMPSPGFESMSYCTAISVANHYIGLGIRNA
ncbi:hypothetical protein TNCV_3189011 [Trichonephila clavipes]|nr:hypothetical protein TNCV_3189011 [Trichonephila clavipes]